MSVVRHTAYNLAGSVLPIAVTLVTVPLYLKAIGLERYGVLALVWVLAGYFNFFDFGIGRAAARKMATLASAPAEARNRLFWTSAAISGALAAAAAVAFWPVAILFVRHMDIPAVLQPELRESMPLLVAAVPVGIVQSLLAGVLDGRRAFGAANAIAVVGNVLTAVLPLASAWLFGPRLSLLIAATLAARGLIFVAQLIACRRIVPLGRPQREGGAEIASLVKFGGWVTVTGIVGPFLAYFDRFAIGAILGAVAVGHYVVGYNLVMQMQVVPNALARSLFPRLAELDRSEADSRSADGLLVISAISAPIAVFALAIVKPFFTIWLGASVAKYAAPPAAVLMIGFWANAIAQIPYAVLHSRERPDLTAKVHVAELLPYAGLLGAGLALYGIVGAAAAWSLRCLADYLVLSHLARLRNRWAIHILSQGAILAIALAAWMYVRDMWLCFAIIITFAILSAGVAWMSVPEYWRERAFGFRRSLSAFWG